ncbi:unnamed protein product [Closterium sp. NIES-65]|nr:unnamed protein product [Closterium sp. NIES-65]
MASRLKAVLHEVISEDQYGFIPGRQLADAVSVVADAIEAGANGKEDWYLMMIDFQKAFDSISRDYLFGALRKLGLPEDFVGWTIGLHKEAGTCLHINGWTGDKVAVEKGVRQGCPLAPYLFLYAVEPLCQEISRAKLGIGKKGVGKLAYLGYADDTSLLLHGVEQLEAVAGVLSAFGEESGLKEHLAFNPNIPFRGASPFGNQKGAEALLGIRMGDLIVKARDGTCELKKLATLARELGCREKAKWALRAFNAAPATWKEMVLAKLTSEEIVATVKLLRSSNGATGGFTYWKVGEARGDTVEGILCDIGDRGHFSPYEGNLKMYFNLRSGVPMFTEGSVFLGPMGDVRTKLLLSAACERGELITLKGIRKVLADSAGPQEEQRRWEGQRRVIEWDRVIEQRDSLVTPRRAREILIRLHCRNLQVGSRLFFMGVVCPHCQGEETPDHCLLDCLAVQGVADVMRHGLEIMRPGLVWQDLEDLLFMQRSTRSGFLEGTWIATFLHQVWLARCNAMWRNEAFQPGKVTRQAVVKFVAHARIYCAARRESARLKGHALDSDLAYLADNEAVVMRRICSSDPPLAWRIGFNSVWDNPRLTHQPP